MLLAIGERPISTVPKAVDEMYREHHVMVFRAAHRVTGNIADAEDVLQTVFLRLVRRDPAAAGEIDNPESYLRRSAVNAALDLVRARRDASNVDLDRLPSHGSGADRLGDLREQLQLALASLPARSAEMFALRFLEGLTNPQIAKAMGLSQMVVAVTLHRTRRKLQKLLR